MLWCRAPFDIRFLAEWVTLPKTNKRVWSRRLANFAGGFPQFLQHEVTINIPPFPFSLLGSPLQLHHRPTSWQPPTPRYRLFCFPNGSTESIYTPAWRKIMQDKFSSLRIQHHSRNQVLGITSNVFTTRRQRYYNAVQFLNISPPI